MIICWIIALLGAGFGGLFLIVGLNAANGAPQEASVAALAIVPYCFARAVQGLRGTPIDELERIRQALEKGPSGSQQVDPESEEARRNVG